MLEDPSGVSGVYGVNDRTQLVSPLAPESARRAPLGPRAAFLAAYETLEELAEIVSGPAFLLAAVDPRGNVTASLALPDRRALILGRHTECGLRIQDTTVALRQVAALARCEGERLIIHVRDLGTDAPFITEDGTASSGVMADGPLYIALGSVAVWFLPWPGTRFTASAEQVWDALPARTFIDRRAPEAGVRRALVDEPARSLSTRPPPSMESTQVTHFEAPLLLDDGDEPEVGWGTLKISRAGGPRVQRSVSAERLEQGILLGRYDRCSLVIQTPQNTLSRVHVLLLRIGGEVWIVDTASTNGVERGGERVLAEVLRDSDRLELGSEITLEWTRIHHPEA